MNMQQMVQQVQKMQRMYEKEHKILEETEFNYITNGVISLTLKGDMSLVSIKILDEDILEKDNLEMIQDMIKLAYDNVRDQILQKEEELASKFKVPGGFGF